MPVIKALLLLGLTAAGQNPPVKPYTNEDLGFEFSYPTTYRIAKMPPQLAQRVTAGEEQSLLYVHTGDAQHGGNIHVTLDKRNFDLATLKRLHSRGDEDPVPIKVGENTFYYYGRGGGGVLYPDEYFYDLNGYILEFAFDGPYAANDNSPSAETKETERMVLQSFRRGRNPPAKAH